MYKVYKTCLGFHNSYTYTEIKKITIKPQNISYKR